MDQETIAASDIDLRLDHTNDSEAQVDASVLTLAAVFGPVAFPAAMPDYQKQAIMDRAERDRDAAGDLIIGNRLNPSDPRQHQAKADADDDDNLAQYAQLVRKEHEEREREEWSRTKSTVGGVTMTGAEWAQFADRLRNDEDLHRRVIEAFERRGMTHDEAETRYARVADVAEIAAIPESQRTEAQTATFEKAKADPTFKTDTLQTADVVARRPAAEAESDLGRDAEASSSNETAVVPTAQPERRVDMTAGPRF